ncbi:MAG: GDP-mannose 4,6-dehydratase [Acidimicrobiia bacterium]
MSADGARILVTGGAGFIGSHLVDSLVADGHRVAVLDLLTTGRKENLDRSIGAIEFVHGSILDAEVVERLVAGADVVFHLAAAVGVRHIVTDPLGSIVTNVRGTDIVLEACARHGRRTLVASTSEIYGKTPQLPMSEDDDRVLGPTSVHRWSYSTSKAVDEHLALAYAEVGLPVSIVRYFNSYGPRLDPRGYGSVLAQFLRQATAGEPITVHGDGLQTRCFTFVADTVRGTVSAGLSDAAVGQVVNLGSDHEITIAELAQRVRDYVGSSSEIRHVTHESYYGPGFADTRRRVPDISRARQLLGWEPTVDLEEGLGRTYEWWKDNVS